MIRVLFLFLCFFMDVHVRASEVHHDDAHHGAEPAASSCANFPCTISAKKKYVLKKPSVIIDVGSLAEQRAADSLHMVRGTFLIQDPGTFSATYATFTCEGECTALAERFADRVTFKNIHGDWQVTRIGDKQTYAVPPAMQVVVRAVSADGQAEMEFPQSLPWLPTVKTWARLNELPKEDFVEAMGEFREVWEQAVEAASAMHTDVAKREIASRDKAEAAAQAARLAREKEDAQLRRLFREKNGL